MNRNVLFVSDTSPNNRLASPVIFYRHLCRLEDAGWKINLVLHAGDLRNYIGRDSWRVKVLPMRRAWWPPFRPYGFLARLRFRLLLTEIRSYLASVQPDVIIGYLHGVYLAEFAARVSHRYHLPLGYFYHDASELFQATGPDLPALDRFTKLKRRLIDRASVVWAVSPAMLAELDESKSRLLYPMSDELPERGRKPWDAAVGQGPVIVHAGTVYNETVEPLVLAANALAQLGGRLVLFTDSTEAAARLQADSAGQVEVNRARPVPDVCAEVWQRAAAMLVAYPSSVSAMPWIRTNFPSKFVQFTGVGVPTWILAPRGSAMAEWAFERNYPALLSNYSPESLVAGMRQLLQRDTWQASVDCGLKWWEEEFRPELIATSFERDLESIVSRGDNR